MAERSNRTATGWCAAGHDYEHLRVLRAARVRRVSNLSKTYKVMASRVSLVDRIHRDDGARACRAGAKRRRRSQ